MNIYTGNGEEFPQETVQREIDGRIFSLRKLPGYMHGKDLGIIENITFLPGETLSHTVYEESIPPHQEIPNESRQGRDHLSLYNPYGLREGATYFASHELIRAFTPQLLQYCRANVADILSSEQMEGEVVKRYPYLSEVTPESVTELMYNTNERTEDLFTFYATIAVLSIGTPHALKITDRFREFAQGYSKENGVMHYKEKIWTDIPSLVIWDDSKIFHGRFGNNNTPLGRAWFMK